jgi:putative ABC transport system ATP-binding protein
MLEMKGIARIYRTDLVETHALRDLTLTVNEGDFTAVVGPSGSGKTTFLNIAGLLEDYDEGTFLLDGENVSGLNDRQRSKLRNEKIGFIFQGFNLIADLNVFDNVDVPLRYRGFPAAERKRRIEEQIERFGLSGRIRHFPSQLSGGQQQRVAIARALAGDPRFLLADEPTGNLDSASASGVLDLLEELHQSGTTIIMVTHDPALAARVPSSIHLQDGRVINGNGAAA